MLKDKVILLGKSSELQQSDEVKVPARLASKKGKKNMKVVVFD